MEKPDRPAAPPCLLAYTRSEPSAITREYFRGGSRLNLVERWFRDLSGKALRRGVFHSVPDLIAAIEEYMQVHNIEPKAFLWTTTAESILTKAGPGRVAVSQTVSQ